MSGGSKGRSSGRGGSRILLYIVAFFLIILVAQLFVFPLISPLIFPAQKPGPSISLNAGTDIPGATVTISGKNLTKSVPVNATLEGTTLAIQGTCSTDSSGALSGCTFVVPRLPSGRYNVTVTDGTHSPSEIFTVPSILPPESTIIVTITSIGLGLVTQLVTRTLVDLDAERKMKAEVNAFQKEKRAATLAKDKAKLDKLKKRDMQILQLQNKIQTARFKVTGITFVPLIGIYYLMASFLGGYGVTVAHSPFVGLGLPILFASDGNMALLWWYFLNSFTFSTILAKVLHTTT